jgi:hypothetical protein
MNWRGSKPYASAASAMVSKEAIEQPTQAIPRRASTVRADGQPSTSSARVV